MKYILIELDNLILDYLEEKDVVLKDEIAGAIVKECSLLKIALYNQVLSVDNETALSSFYNLHMQRLVELSDLAYEAGSNSATVQSALLGLMDGLKKALPTYINRDIALPKAFRAEQFVKLSSVLDSLLAGNCALVSNELISVLTMPLEAFGDLTRKLSWFHFIWLKRFLHSLSGMLKLEDCQASVIRLMIAMDFNGEAFGEFCQQVYLEKVRECEDQDSLDYVLNLELKALIQLPELSRESFFPDSQPIRDSLQVWLNQEISFHAEFDGTLMQDTDKPMRLNRLKLRYNLTVDQLAFWQKLQYDSGLFDEPDLGILSEKMAYNFSSANQQEISASSIKSKFYPKDYRVISPLHLKTKSMIENLQALLVILEKMIADMEPFLR
ncbi:MAG: hypothetical protein V4594_12510 [Bacteroidota bacterium]